jgi:ubiquinone/menaquinone biosynthesis C-methylase UbiE
MDQGDDVCESKRFFAATYDEASDIYDTYEGLFFPYLFDRIDEILKRDMIPSLPQGAKVLDIGCGTGRQTRLFKERGYDVTGIDISSGLVKVANKKLGCNICFPSDACKLPFKDGTFDAVTSAGSTVNHIPDYDCFFSEIGRVLKPGGVVFMEADNKWRPDMLWCLASVIVGDPLKYHETLKNVVSYFKRPIREGYKYIFPLTFDENKVRELHLRTFTYAEIKDELKNVGCDVKKAYGIHCITNAIPSTVMLQDKPGRVTMASFNVLKKFENLTYRRWPVNRISMSICVIAKKKE